MAVGFELPENHLVFFEKGFKIKGFVIKSHQVNDDAGAFDMPQKTGAKILILEDIQDPGNAGTLIRTAAAFDFSGIIMTEKCADPFSPKCVQATAGSILSLWIRRTKNYLPLIQAWQKEGYKLVAADLNGAENPETLHSFPKMMLALGNEASGLSSTLLNISDYKIRIPLNSKKVQSLNVAACGAICMFLTR